MFDPADWDDLVRRVAYSTRVPLELEDRVQEGWFGVRNAEKAGALHKDKSRIVGWYIHNAIIDAARKFTRYRSQRANKLDFVSLETLVDTYSRGDDSATSEWHIELRIGHFEPDVSEEIVDLAGVRAAMVGLKHGDVLEEYADGSTLKEIGERRGYSESRACQCLRIAREQLRERLTRDND